MNNTPQDPNYEEYAERQANAGKRNYGKPEDIKVEDISFRDRVIEVMEDQNWSQTELATLTDYTQGGLRHALAGISYPNYKFVRNLLLALPELSAEWLTRAEGNKYKSKGNITTNTATDRSAVFSNANKNKFVQKLADSSAELTNALARAEIAEARLAAAEKLIEEKERLIGILLHQGTK